MIPIDLIDEAHQAIRLFTVTLIEQAKLNGVSPVPHTTKPSVDCDKWIEVSKLVHKIENLIILAKMASCNDYRKSL